MYIEPSTNIKILKDVPLDTTYDHTIYFTNKQEQSTYFMSLKKYDLENYTYQRVKRGVARVGIKADNLYDCNYIMFQNTSFGNKWFYAFITSVEYLNNECSEIMFEIDVMQTWFFDYEPDYCFVEREHSVTDGIGENIIPENIDTGEYVFNGYGKITQVLDPLCVVIMVSDTDSGAYGTLYDGIFGGCKLYAYDVDDVDNIVTFLSGYSSKPDAIVGMYMCPVIGTGGAIGKGGVVIEYSAGSYTFNVTSEPIKGNEPIALNYYPKNKKLYTYPYNFLVISNGKSTMQYRYEFFDALTPIFEINVPITMPVQVALRPRNYKGSGNNTLNTETMVLDDYPMCSWTADSFSAWLAQNSLPIASSVAGVGLTALAGISGVAIPAIGALAGANHVASLFGQGYKASIAADLSKGNLNSGNIDVASGNKTFFGGRCTITWQYAKTIDDYFTMYGYATRRIKKPNRNSRPHWNYVKTVGCTITGSVPCDDMKKIAEIYDNGITFWKKGSEVGDYSLDNTV